MINTIEIAPHIVAYELAKFLNTNKYDYISTWDNAYADINTETLRNLILDFLKDDKNGQVVEI